MIELKTKVSNPMSVTTINSASRIGRCTTGTMLPFDLSGYPVFLMRK